MGHAPPQDGGGGAGLHRAQAPFRRGMGGPGPAASMAAVEEESAGALFTCSPRDAVHSWSGRGLEGARRTHLPARALRDRQRLRHGRRLCSECRLTPKDYLEFLCCQNFVQLLDRLQ